jgi:hypothetical protein
LIQAKMARAAGRVSVAGKSSVVQLDLYQNGYSFDFEDLALGMTRVNFNTGVAAADSGTFGVIDRHLIDPTLDPPVWTQHAATPTPHVINLGHTQLGEFMAELVDGTRSGFGRLATPSIQTDWNKAVERLLTVTYASTFHHKATLGSASAPRGVSAVACLGFKTMSSLTKTIWGRTGGPPFGEVLAPAFDEPPSGISIVHIKLDDEDSSAGGSVQSRPPRSQFKMVETLRHGRQPPFLNYGQNCPTIALGRKARLFASMPGAAKGRRPCTR